MRKIGTGWIVLVIALVAVLDVTAFNYAKVGNTKPDVFLIAVLFFALYGGSGTGAFSGFAAGLMKDIFAGGLFGVNILFMVPAGIFFGYNFSKFYRERPLTQFILSFLLSLAYILFYYLFFKFARGAGGFADFGLDRGHLLLAVGVPFSIYTAAAAPPFFFIMRRLFRLSH